MLLNSAPGSGRWSIGWRDAWLPAALAVVGLLELASLQPVRWPIGMGIEVLACLVLVARRTFPLVAPTLAGLILLATAFVGPGMDGPSLPIPMLLLGVFALGRWNADLRGLVGAFSASVIGRLEVARMTDAQRNDVLTPVPHPELKEHLASSLLASTQNMIRASRRFPWWLRRNRLFLAHHEAIHHYLIGSATMIRLHRRAVAAGRWQA